MAKETLSRGADIKLCDPWVNPLDIAKVIPSGKYTHFNDPYKSVKSSNVIIGTTPWPDLKKLDYQKISKLMSEPKVFFDAWNYFHNEINNIEKSGLRYIGIGI